MMLRGKGSLKNLSKTPGNKGWVKEKLLAREKGIQRVSPTLLPHKNFDCVLRFLVVVFF